MKDNFNSLQHLLLAHHLDILIGLWAYELVQYCPNVYCSTFFTLLEENQMKGWQIPVKYINSVVLKINRYNFHLNVIEQK